MAGTRCISGREIRQLLEGFVADLGEREGRRAVRAHFHEALEKKQLRPQDFSIRELFEACVQDGASIAHSWSQPKSGYGAELLEAGPGGSVVGYSDFTNITGQIMFSEIKDKYEDIDFIFSKEIEHKASAIQDVEKIPGVSRIGKARAKIQEGAAYPRYGVSEDYIEIAAKIKDGGIVEVTKEIVAGDKTGVLLDRCGELGYDLGYNLEERVIDAIIDENDGAVSAHSGGHRYTWKGTAYASYQTATPWINSKTSNALTVDESSVDAVWQLLVAITDPYTGRPINNVPENLIVAPDLAFKAARLLGVLEHRTTVPGYATTSNPVQASAAPALPKVIGNLKLMTSPILKTRLGTDTTWFLGTIRKAVKHYYNWDIVTTQRGAGTEDEFHRDVVTQFKASIKDCVAVVEPRYMAKSAA